MVKYALNCQSCGGAFEAWFSNAAGFDEQKSAGLVQCPHCDSADVEKAIMAPAVRPSGQKTAEQAGKAAFQEMAKKVRTEIATKFDFVGKEFATEARAIHYGDKEERPIWGQATATERKELNDEGVTAASLPDAFAPPVPKTDGELN